MGAYQRRDYSECGLHRVCEQSYNLNNSLEARGSPFRNINKTAGALGDIGSWVRGVNLST